MINKCFKPKRNNEEDEPHHGSWYAWTERRAQPLCTSVLGMYGCMDEWMDGCMHGNGMCCILWGLEKGIQYRMWMTRRFSLEWISSSDWFHLYAFDSLRRFFRSTYEMVVLAGIQNSAVRRTTVTVKYAKRDRMNIYPLVSASLPTAGCNTYWQYYRARNVILY